MGWLWVLGPKFLSFLLSFARTNAYDIGPPSAHGLELALHSLQLLNRALLYIWYFYGFKQTNTHTHTHTPRCLRAQRGGARPPPPDWGGAGGQSPPGYGTVRCPSPPLT